jgi:hypothetical protein
MADNIWGWQITYVAFLPLTTKKWKKIIRQIHSIHPQIHPAQILSQEMRDNGKERGNSEGAESAGQITGR